MSDIFISYSSADRSRVEPLVDQLQRRGWSVWWDRTIQPGKTWDQVIDAALNQARCVIVLWSRESIQSDWVKTEADEAKRRGILVPALLDDVVIPLGFRRIQAANLTNCSGDLAGVEFDKLLRAVAEVPGIVAPLLTAEAPEARHTERRFGRSVASERFSRRTLALIGGSVLACTAAFGWYFASHARSGKPTTERPAAPLTASPGHVNEDAKAGSPAIRTPAPPRPGTAFVPGQTRIDPSDGLTYVYIPPGVFTMGCSPGDSECFGIDGPTKENEKQPHTETIATGFWLSQTEVTQAAWDKVMGGNPSHFKGGRLPVESVDWNGAVEYCTRTGGRLPTEKEWEYAARAGSKGARYGALDATAWYNNNSGGSTHLAGTKQANAWGLYDMLGNVGEWTADDYNAKAKVVRGGSWWGFSGFARASAPDDLGATDRLNNVGFRCVAELR